MAVQELDIEPNLPIINGDYNTWGTKLNAILLDMMQAKINELAEQINVIDNDIYGGSASSVYLANQNLNGGGA